MFLNKCITCGMLLLCLHLFLQRIVARVEALILCFSCMDKVKHLEVVMG